MTTNFQRCVRNILSIYTLPMWLLPIPVLGIFAWMEMWFPHEKYKQYEPFTVGRWIVGILLGTTYWLIFYTVVVRGLHL